MTKTPPTTAPPPLNENNEQQADSSNSGAEAGTQQSDTPATDTSNTAQPNDNAAPAATGNCAAVTDWATLKDCIENGTGDVTVTITAPITADKGDSIAITRNVTLVSRIPLNSDNMNPSAFQFNNGDNSGSVFTINEGGHLTIGKATDDNAFTYAGTETASIARRFAQVNKNGALTINGGIFQYIAVDNGALAFVQGGSIVINGGKFQDNKATRGSVLYVANTTDKVQVDIHGGVFSRNASNMAAGVIMQDNRNGVLTIDKTAAFSNNSAGSKGGVIHNNGTLTIAGGTFAGNKAKNAGGVISQAASTASTTVTGGTFDSNQVTQELNAGRLGGGVIFLRRDGANDFASAGKLLIEGGVFKNNYVAIAGNSPHCGGGAIWAQGDVTINGGVFANNYAAGMTSGWSGGGAVYIYSGNGIGWGAGDGHNSYHSTLIVYRGTFLNNATHGGGGAIFLGWWSTAIFTGISGQNAPAYGSVEPTTPVWFEGNQAEHLGGAVYTEESTTTFMGKSVAYNNGAGHFGGGLWLCPSGKGFNSKGGNMLLFSNTVNGSFDVSVTRDATKRIVNTRNSSWGQSGNDFAIMAPTKSGITKNSFELSDEDWSGEKGAIEWTADAQQPSKTTNGYTANNADTNHMRTVPLNDTSNGKYSNSVVDGKRQWTGTTNINQEQERPDEGKEAGVGLTSTMTSDMQAEAKANAMVTFTNNHASLSGGAFGTNGNIMFSTPFSMSWSKAKATEASNGTATVPTNAERLGGSKWKLSTIDGGPLEPSMRPVDCMMTFANATTPESCWHNLDQQSSSNRNPAWVIIEDNGNRDNDLVEGDISINNLKAGTYTLEETLAPTNYQKTTSKYTFTIVAPDAGSVYVEPKLTVSGTSDGKGPIDSTGKVVGNLPDQGSVSWDKIDANNGTKYLSGSEWQIKDNNDDVISGYDSITDNTGQTGYNGKDTNTVEGRFTVKGLSADTSYQLCEITVPVGYWKPANENKCRTFRINKFGVVESWSDNSNGRIKNTPTQVSWSKISIDNQTLLAGSEWTVETCDTSNGDLPCTTVVADSAHTVTDCASGSCAAPSTGKYYLDVDSRGSGYITIRNLPVGMYRLTESKAPEGYVLSKTAYTFTISEDKPSTEVQIDAPKGASLPVKHDTTYGKNAIPNVRAVAALPLTGGPGDWAARDWLLIGGGLAVAAAGAMALTYEWRRRKAVSL